MTEPFTDLALLTRRSPDRIFDPPPELVRLRQERPMTRMVYGDGHIGWLVTGHPQAREVLADPRFSSRYELMHLPLEGVGDTKLPPAPDGDLTGIDPPLHTRYRRLLAGAFTVRRMRLLTQRVEQIVGECLDAMEQQGPPVDLIPAFAQPVPTLMICEMLGVPYADRETFQRLAEDTLYTPESTPESQWAAMAVLQEYIDGLVQQKRKEPTDDILGELAGHDLTNDELTGLGAFLLGAGLHTVAATLGLGTLALLQNPGQLAALRTDPDVADSAVEELLRYLTIGPLLMRTALEDAEIDGNLVKAGDTVAISVTTANRDPAKFTGDPDALDLYRPAAGHLTFVHGAHLCLGQHLARIELKAAFPALLQRFPALRPAVPLEQVPVRTETNMVAVERFPVEWDT